MDTGKDSSGVVTALDVTLGALFLGLFFTIVFESSLSVVQLHFGVFHRGRIYYSYANGFL